MAFHQLEPSEAARAKAMAYFAVAKTQAGSGDIADLPGWFLANPYPWDEGKDEHRVSYHFSVFWMNHNHYFSDLVHNGEKTRVTMTKDTGQIVLHSGFFETNRIDLFD